ncbi:RHS repeat-associated core domain-containing protein [Micromonospora sp. NPDC050200]|uniref:RHS repeat-associated core domain-containing protein n=1 Tax=Micromonospora sp. NPDC050200 TaxID=3155664 RepID=UPI00340D12EE
MSRSKVGRFASLVGLLGSGATAKVLAVGVTVAVVAGMAGSDVPRSERPQDAAGGDRQSAQAAPAPGQRWAPTAASAAAPATGGKNKTLPASLRGKYPAVKWKPQSNKASMTVAPKRTLGGYDKETSVPAATQPGPFEKLYDNADGTQTTEFSGSPVNYRKADGTWAPIDTRLVPEQKDGGWRNTADSVGLKLAGSATATELARVTFDERHSVAYSMAGVSGGIADAAGSAVTYRGVAPSVDLRLEARPGGLKETVVLASGQAPASFLFPLELTGLTARLDGGQVVLADETGAVRGVIPAGTSLDAAGEPGTVGYELIEQGGAPALKVSVDEDWLRDPKRAFPVEVDPTVQVPVDGAASDSSMYVKGGSSASGSDQLLAGTVDGANSASYVKFGSLVSKLQNHTIFGAKLWVVNYDADSCRPRQVTVHPVTGSWSAGAGYSYPGPAVGGSLASKSFAHGYIAFGQSSSACPTAGELIDLGTGGRDLVQRWVNGTQANYGLSLRASTDSLSGKRFAGSGTANAPKLYVTHTPYYATYSVPNPVPNPVVLQNQDGKIKVAVTNKGAGAWAPGDFYLAYRAYKASNGAAVTQQRSASLTSTVARGGRVTLDATIKALPPGKYFLDFTMVKTGGPVFTDYQVPPARLVLEVFNIPPVVQELYPPNGYQAPTLTPQLWARALDIDAPPSSSLQYKFEVCDRDASGNPVSCTNSGYTTKTAWTVPAGRLVWSKAYLWRTFVKDASAEVASPYSTVLTAVPQPEITSRMSGSEFSGDDQDFDPQVGNYSTEALDASVATAGPELRLIRTYNSADPRRDALFGAGWTSRYDMKVVPDDDGSGNVVITYPDGRAVRFGRNADGTYAAPAGRIAKLQLSISGWQLTDADGRAYQFSLTGQLAKILDVLGRAVTLTYNTADGKLSKAQVSNSQTNTAGRSLTFTWSGGHVASVATDPVDGTRLTWNYTYTGDLLSRVCAPGGGCTSYEYAAGSHYRSTVQDSRPESYWRLGEPDGTAAASEVAVNLGEDAGTLKNVVLGQAGVLAGTGNTAGLFNGATSAVDLPKGTLKKSRDAAVELWFKQSTSGSGGPLLGYQDKALGSASTVGVPILYVGTDGKLRGQFATGTIAPITSAVAVNDGRWHHAVLSAMGTTQTLYLDNVKVGTLTGTIEHSLLTFNQIGSAYASTPASWPGWGSTAQRSYTGTIDEVAYYTHPLGASSVAGHYKAIAQADQLAKVVLPSGKVAGTAAYDTDLDRIEEQTDADGGTWKIGAPTVYGGDTDLRRSVEVRDPAGRPSLYEYDAIGGWLLRLGQPLGIEARDDDDVTEPSPSPSAPPTETCAQPDPNDPAFCTTIPGDAGGPVFVRYDADGVSIRTFAHNEDGSVGTVTDENGDTVTLTYNSRGNVTSTKQCRTGTQCYTSWTTYPATVTNTTDPRNDQPLEIRDARSASATDTTYRTVFTYHASGQPATQTNPDGGVVRNTYTTGGEGATGGGLVPAGLLATSTDPRNKVTRYAYYANGDLASVTAPSGLVTSYTYDALGRKISEKQVSDTFPDGVTTTYTYDGMGRLLTRLDPATTDAVGGKAHRQRATYTYDADGNVTSVEAADASGGDPARVTAYEYDDHNRQTRVTDAEGNETEYGYDGFGNTVSMTDANGNRYDYAYTARNALAEVRLRDWRSDPAGAPATGTGDYLVLRGYSYDLAGRAVSVTDAMGRRVENTYYRDGSLQKSVLKNFHDPGGSTRDIVLQDNVYDGAGNLTKQVTDNGKRTVEHTYDRAGRVATTVADPGGLARTTTYGYDLAGNVTRTVMSGKASNVPWTMPTTPETVDYVVDDAGNVTKETATDGSTTQVTTYAYDQRGLRVAETDPRGNADGADPAAFTTTYRYDERGQQVGVTGAPVPTETGGGQPVTAKPAVTTGYGAFGDTAATRDALGQVTTIDVDKLGRPVRVAAPSYLQPGVSEPIQPVSLTRYDGNGNAVETTDPRGNVTRTTYDQLNRVVTVDEPGDTNDERAVWSYTYTRTGQPLSQVDPTGARVEATYDDMDRQVTSTDKERRPVAATYTTVGTYDDAGNLTRVVSPTGAPTASRYDSLGQLIEATDPNGVVTQLGYDYSGRQVRTVDGLGATRTTYDLFGQKVGESRLEPDGSVVSTVGYRYDLAGNVIAEIDPKQVTTSYAYDAGNRMTQQAQPVSATESIITAYGYDAAGNRTRFTDGRGNSTITTYNTLGLPQSQIEPATAAQPAAADRTWTSTYDAAGNVIAEVAPGGVRSTAEYDAAGRMRTSTGTGAESATATRTLRYDLAGRPIEASSGTGVNAYGYDDRGNLLSTAGPGGSATFRYDGDGNQTSRADAAGAATFGYTKARLSSVTDAVTGTTQQVTYDSGGMLRTIGYGAGRTRTYTYDAQGQVSGDTLTNAAGTTVAATTYRYDEAGRLSAETRDRETTYTYDYAGRLTGQTTAGATTAYEWDAAGNRIKAGAKTAGYDERGRLLSDGDYTYTYTARGTMKTRTSSGLTEQFAFDAFDRLTDAAGQKYTYDGLDRVASRNGVGFSYAGLDDEVVADGTSVYGRGPGDELLATGTGGTERLALSDRHGDVVGGFDPADTTLAKLPDSTAYDPFGTVTQKTGSTGAIGFQGDWTDPGTGQVDMGDRWYSPATGGFTSRDSADTSAGADGGNRYAYAAGDPLGRIDPDGHSSCWLPWVHCSSASDTVVPCSSYIFCWLQNEMPYNIADALRAQADAQRRAAGGKKDKPRLPGGSYPSYAPGRAGSGGGNGVSCGYCYRESPYERAKKVSDAARSANAYAAKHKPLPVYDSALLPLLNMAQPVSSKASAPANTTATSKDVVSDQRKGTTKIYNAAVDKAGPVVENVSGAASTTYTYTWTDRIKGYLGLGGGGGEEHKPTKWAGLRDEAVDVYNALGGDDMERHCDEGSGLGDFFNCALDVGLLLAPELRLAKPAAVGVRAAAGAVGREVAENVTGVACAAAGNSFTGDTRVRMADSSVKRIDAVRAGEKVLATDPTTGRSGSFEVTGVIIGTGEKHLVEIAVDGGGTVTATDGHPFWDAERDRWVEAGDLAVRSWTERQTVYNLTVDTLHTYFVVAGSEDLLVHNIDWRKCGRALTAPFRMAGAAAKGVYNHVLTPIGHGMTAAGRGIGHGITAAGRRIGSGTATAGRRVAGTGIYKYVVANPKRAAVQCLGGNAVAGGGGAILNGGREPLLIAVPALLGCFFTTWKDSIPTKK